MKNRILPLLAILIVTISCSSPVTFRAIATPTEEPTPVAIVQPIQPVESPTPTLPPTPTPLPSVRIEIAEEQLFIGNYEQARREFQNAQAASDDMEIQAAAALGMGRSLYLTKNYAIAITTLEAMVKTYPDSSQLANAYFFLAKCYEEQQLYDKAAAAYEKYLELRPGVLDSYINEMRGDALMAAGLPLDAAAAYQAAAADPNTNVTVWTKLKIGKAYAAGGDFSNAIKTYLDVYETSDNDYARAQANLLMGRAYLAMGMPEQAYARFQDSVVNFPAAYDTYTGLVQLVTDGVPVNYISRGIVDYYAQQYGLAIEALNRHIETAEEVSATAYHYRALSRLALNEPGMAIADWDYIIENFPDSDLWATAWDEKAYTQWAYLGRFDTAAQTYLQFVEQAPDHPKAPEFLYYTARVFERNLQLTEAAETWERIIEEYPSAEQGYRSLFLASVTYYRAGDFDRALSGFQRVVVLSTNPSEHASAYLWIGKVHKAKGDDAAARSAWEKGAQQDPTGYYSIRCNELLLGRAPFTIDRPVDLGYDLNQERAIAEEWLRAKFSIPPEVDLSGPGELVADPRYIRGTALWDLGLFSAARNEFEQLRDAVKTDAVKTYRLLNTMLEMGLYRSSIFASRQILDLANMDDISSLEAPAFFNHIRFGVYFKDQIMQASKENNHHPLLLLSVMRQESMFEGFATSGAGARGLMQIMPETGQEIASGLNWPQGFTPDDLYRPEVSIRLGARYLARQRDYFGGDIFTALAAYNGGPGNTIAWSQLAGGDPDLLLEVIRADETRQYIMNIVEYFNIYRLLYERGL